MKKEKKQPKIGGLVFFVSLLFLAILNALFLLMIPTIFSSDAVLRHWTHFMIGTVVGSFGASLLIAGRLQVFFHELNHKVLSGLVGNKPKRLKVGKDEGFFEYEYTKETAAYNAFIALAPYFFPLFTIGAFIIALLGWRQDHDLSAAIVGIGYGADLYLNTRVISPRQTDFSSLHGGFTIGLLYVTLVTAAIFFVVAAWVSNGFLGIWDLLSGLFQLALAMFSNFSGRPLPGAL